MSIKLFTTNIRGETNLVSAAYWLGWLLGIAVIVIFVYLVGKWILSRRKKTRNAK